MRCRRARNLLIERDLEPLRATVATELDDHLACCTECSGRAEVEAMLTAELTSLRFDAPSPVDVAGRVVAQIETVRPGDAAEVPTWPFGWATAAALTCGLALTWALWEHSPGLVGIAREIGSVLAATKPLLSAAADPIVTVASAIGRLVANLLGAAAHVLRSVRPIGIAALLSAVGMMASTIALVVARDLRKPSSIREDYR
jgi:hypothetical protein